MGGLALAAIAGLSVLGERSAFGFLLCGFGVALTGGGYALAFARQSLRELTIGPQGATLVSADGSSVTVPCAISKGARVHEVVQSTTSTSSGGSTSRSVSRQYFVHLQKQDGGVIDLGQQRDQATAERLAAEVTAALDRFRPAAEASAPLDPLALLSESSHLSARRQGEEAADYRKAAKPGDLVVEWSLRPQHFEAVPALLLPLAFALALYGFHLREGSGLLLALAAVLLGLDLFLVVRFLTRLGVSQVLRIDERQLSIEKHRGGRRVEHQAVPLDTVTAVDFSLQSNTLGGVLQLRLNEAKAPAPPPGAEGPSLGALASVVKQAVHLHRNSVNVPLGRLPFGDRVRVDLAVSAEIAQRTARDEASL